MTYITLVDTKHDGMQIRTKTKGRPIKNQTLEKDGNASTYEQVRNELQLDGSPDILLAIGWLTDSEARLLQMFPEVWYVDVTNQTNNEKRQLLILAGKDGMCKGFTGMRVFLPSEQKWVFGWFFKHCVPQLLGDHIVKQNKLVLTDGDWNMYLPLRVLQGIKESPWFGSMHKFCQFHLLGQS